MSLHSSPAFRTSWQAFSRNMQRCSSVDLPRAVEDWLGLSYNSKLLFNQHCSYLLDPPQQNSWEPESLNG